MIFLNKKMSSLLILILTFCAPFANANICDRESNITASLEEVLKKSCAEINSADLASVTSLNLNNRKIKAISRHDLSGLTSLKVFILSYNYVGAIPADLFRDTPDLKNIDIGDTGIDSLPAGLFSGLSALESVNLEFNRGIKSIPKDTFAGLNTLQYVRLWGIILPADEKEALAKEYPNVSFDYF